MKGKSIAIAAIGLLALTSPTQASSRPHIDARCQRMYEYNIGHTSKEIDWIGNYAGCDEVYHNGSLIGFGRGDTQCERRAYRGALILGYEGTQFHRYMGKGSCVLYDDLAWGGE